MHHPYHHYHHQPSNKNHPNSSTHTSSNIVENDMQNSFTTTSWAVLCNDAAVDKHHPNIELLRQLEQSMEFGSVNDDDDDDDDDDDVDNDWSQSDDDNDQNIYSKRHHHKTKSITTTIDENNLSTLWKARCLYLVRFDFVICFHQKQGQSFFLYHS
jgi:hypothetical protein